MYHGEDTKCLTIQSDKQLILNVILFCIYNSEPLVDKGGGCRRLHEILEWTIHKLHMILAASPNIPFELRRASCADKTCALNMEQKRLRFVFLRYFATQWMCSFCDVASVLDLAPVPNLPSGSDLFIIANVDGRVLTELNFFQCVMMMQKINFLFILLSKKQQRCS